MPIMRPGMSFLAAKTLAILHPFSREPFSLKAGDVTMAVMIRPRRSWESLTRWQKTVSVLWTIALCLFVLWVFFHKPGRQELFEVWRQWN